MEVEVITLFPDMVEQGLSAGVPRIAREAGALRLTTRNPRDYADNRQKLKPNITNIRLHYDPK